MAHLSKLNHTTDTLISIKADAVSVGIFEDGSLTARGKTINTLLNGQISLAHKRGDIKGKHSETTIFYSENCPVIVIGLGKADEFETECIRKVGGTLVKKAIKMMEELANDEESYNKFYKELYRIRRHFL